MVTVLSNILAWAKKDNSIRAVLLTGSRAAGKTDRYSDYDIALFSKDYQTYLTQDRWLSKLGKVWVYIPENREIDGQFFPTRLVIFDQGINVDFSFFPMKMLKTKFWEPHFKVLIDKDGKTKKLNGSPFKLKKPTAATFQGVVEEFWFECFQITKYLKRGDLWPVKFRDSDVKHRLLLKMIEWNHGAKTAWKLPVTPTGKNMQQWIDKDIWNEIKGIFGHFDAADSWKALFATIDLFRKLAQETAELMGLKYPLLMDSRISKFIQSLQID